MSSNRERLAIFADEGLVLEFRAIAKETHRNPQQLLAHIIKLIKQHKIKL